MSDQSSINKLTESISKLKTAIDEYSLAVEKKIEELKNAKSNAEFTVTQSEEQQERIEAEIEKTNVEKVALQDELNIKKEKLTELIVENLQNGKDIEDLTKKLTIKDEELQGYTKELAIQQEIIIRLNTAIEKQAQEAGQLKDQLIALQEKQITNDAEIAAKDNEIQAIRNTNAELSAEQQANIDRLIQEKESLTTQSATLSAEQQAIIDRLNREKTELEAQNAAAVAAKNNEILAIRNANATLSADQQSTIDRLTQEIIALETANSSAISAKDTEIVNLRQSKDAEIIRLQNEYNTKETVLKESINELQKANGESSEITNKLQDDIAKSTTATSEEKKKNKTLLVEIIKKQNQLTERSNQIKEANDLVANMQSQIDDLREKQSTLTAQHINCQAIIAELNNQIEQANIKINELQAIVEGKTSILNANNDDFGVDITGVAPEPVFYTEPILVEGANGETKIRLKDKSNNHIDFPYDAETGLPKNDVDGSITGFITKWSKTTRQDGSTVYTKESVKKNNPTNKIVKNFTVKGGRKRKASKTVKSTIKKHVSNKRNTKRRNKLHKKQTYRR
jgi:chromosome segregation ATPase